MKNTQLETILTELIGEDGDYINRIRQLSREHPEIQELESLKQKLDDCFYTLRISMKYLLLDIDATSRERDMLKTMLGDKE